MIKNYDEFFDDFLKNSDFEKKMKELPVKEDLWKE
jgi:hypothetical protein